MKGTLTVDEFYTHMERILRLRPPNFGKEGIFSMSNTDIFMATICIGLLILIIPTIINGLP